MGGAKTSEGEQKSTEWAFPWLIARDKPTKDLHPIIKGDGTPEDDTVGYSMHLQCHTMSLLCLHESWIRRQLDSCRRWNLLCAPSLLSHSELRTVFFSFRFN
ncbi:hypothetical protein TNCV_5058061 [Trichonephila clavipes]|nr:hypothetical protein TNCV_5058061 [Trichonephila clavipes]